MFVTVIDRMDECLRMEFLKCVAQHPYLYLPRATDDKHNYLIHRSTRFHSRGVSSYLASVLGPTRYH